MVTAVIPIQWRAGDEAGDTRDLPAVEGVFHETVVPPAACLGHADQEVDGHRMAPVVACQTIVIDLRRKVSGYGPLVTIGVVQRL